MKNLKLQFLKLSVCLFLCFLTAAIGAAASINAGSFYSELILPDWAPPANVFGPVWTLLYIMIAVAAWMVWRVNEIPAIRAGFIIFLIQLVLNALWSWLFFAWKLGGLAFIDIILLWFAILATLIAFWRINKVAGVLLLPYLLWVSFAAFLNFTIWQLNMEVLGG